MVRIEKEILKELGKNRRETAETRKETGHSKAWLEWKGSGGEE